MKSSASEPGLTCFNDVQGVAPRMGLVVPFCAIPFGPVTLFLVYLFLYFYFVLVPILMCPINMIKKSSWHYFDCRYCVRYQLYYVSI